MAAFQYTAGARTRNVINIADVGGEGTVAFTLSSTDAVTGGVPNVLLSSASGYETQGFANHNRQRYLHLTAKNNNSGDNVKIKIWIYNSAAKQWGCLNKVFAQGDGSGLTQAQVELTIADDAQEYFIFDIKGAERVFVQCTDAAGANDCSIWLGVNTV
jgi:hypothetical protein|tara:strand:- start:70 stop:543 length:474 start_codon:yes stop_codon:yes gene_type:complete